MEEVEHMIDYVAFFRGTFINKMSYIERVIELVIANHYCKKDLEIEFIDFVIGEKYFPFEGKKVAFQRIIQTHHGQLFDKYKKMFSNIDLFQPHRNKIAHYMICTTDEAIDKFRNDKTFGLLQYYEMKSPVWYDVELQTKIATAIDEVFQWCRVMPDNN